MRKRVTQRSWTASTLSTQIDIHTPLSEVSLPSGPKVDWSGPLPRLWLGQTRSRRRPCQRLSGESDPIAAAKRIDPAEEDQVEVWAIWVSRPAARPPGCGGGVRLRRGGCAPCECGCARAASRTLS